MFSQACVKNYVHKGGGRPVRGRGQGGVCAWRGGGETATAADAAHPTGMHSYNLIAETR